MNIPVTQIVEEIADREHSSYSDCGRDRIADREEIAFQLLRLWKRSQIVNIPVTQIVEEIADREHSSYMRLWKRSQR